MKPHSAVRVVGFGLLFGSIIYCWRALLPPAPWIDHALNPAYFAFSVATLVAPIYALLAMRTDRRERLERLLLAFFLAGMPVMYLWGALRSHDAGGAVLESVGVLVYGTWAMVGYWRSRMLLAAGIAAHGVGWDAWHHGHVSYIEPHYPLGCLIIDIAFGLAVAGAVFAQAGQSVRGERAALRTPASSQE
jgi:hypothetical protein